MSTTRISAVPQDWDEARDLPFFRITANLFPPAFCFGASVLLASNDDDRAASMPVSGPLAVRPDRPQRRPALR